MGENVEGCMQSLLYDENDTGGLHEKIFTAITSQEKISKGRNIRKC